MDNARLVLVLALSALAALASLAGMFSLIRRRRKARATGAAKGEGEPLPYRRVETLLTASERALYSALRPAAVAQGADVFARVPLADVVQVRKGAPDYEAHCARVAACRIGFLLCDRERLVPLLALEIEGDQPRGGRRDDTKFLGQALAAVGLPLAYVEARTSYDPDVIAALVRDEIARASASASDASATAHAAEAEAPAGLPARPRARPGWQVPAFTASWLEAAPMQAGISEGSAGGTAPTIDTRDEATGVDVAPGGHTQASTPAGGMPGDEAPGEGAESAASAEVPRDADARSTDAAAMPAAEAAGDESAGSAELLCPACGSALVEMQDLETGVVVLACSRYPECPHVQAR